MTRFKKDKKGSKSIETTILNLCIKIGESNKKAKNIIYELKNHQNPLSLEALNDALSRNGIRNKAVSINTNRIKDLPPLTLLYLEEQKEFCMIDEIIENEIVVVDSAKGKIKYSYEELITKWNGITILISSDGNSNILHNEIKNTNYFSGFLYAIVGLVFLGIINYFGVDDIQDRLNFIVICLLNAFGIYVSYSLISFEYLGIHDGIGRYCMIGKSLNCLDVAKSKFSNLFNFLKLSELGIIYFTTLFLLTLFVVFFNHNLIHFVFILNIISIPIVVVSIFYQAFFIKKWCLFCLVIDLIILFQIIILTKRGVNISFSLINILEILVFVFVNITSFYALTYLKKYLKRKVENKSNENGLKYFYRNFDIINHFIEKQRKIEIDPDNLDIVLGNAQFENKIVFLLNPYCKKCKDFFRELQILMSININSQFIIRLIPVNENSIYENKLLNLLYFKNTIESSQYVYTTLEKLYMKNKKRKKYIKNYLKDNSELLSRDSPSHKYINDQEWSKLNGIKSLPTLLINGKEFPKIFPAESVYYYIKKSHVFKN